MLNFSFKTESNYGFALILCGKLCYFNNNDSKIFLKINTKYNFFSFFIIYRNLLLLVKNEIQLLNYVLLQIM